MKYSIIADAYEEIEATTKRLLMTDLLVDFLKKTPKGLVDKVVYLTQGKLYPDYLGIELGIAERLAVKVLASVSGKSERDIDKEYRKLGDLGLTAESILSRKTQQTLIQKPLTVESVYESFDKIARAAGQGSVDLKVKLFSSLLNSASSKEAKYIVRMALGKLRLGVADMTILDALAVAYCGSKDAKADLERAYSLSSDLGYVALVVARDGIKRIRKFKIALGKPIRPMLCERLASPEEILQKLDGKAAVEYKYDGLRIQAHISEEKTYLFSRRLENITSQFPDVVENLQSALKVREAILEGECVGIDPNTGDLLPFQMISQRRGRKYEIDTKTEEVPVITFLFDALYLDGRDLTLLIFPERRKLLEKAVCESDHVKIADHIVTSSVDELEKYFDDAVSSGCEGLVAKSVGENSVYQAGARGWLWIKYKRSYRVEVMDTFDLVPVGALHGRGRRAGSYGALLMAVYNKKTDAFDTLCKLGSGFTDQDLENLPGMTKALLSKHRHPRVNSVMEPHVWFTPGVVLEVAGDEITLSPLHTCGRNVIRKDRGLALRFPRFTGNWRTDKAPEDATTTEEVLEMYHRQLKKIEETPTARAS